MSRKVAVVRSLRKTAHLSRKAFSKAANLSGRIEQKADRIIHGTDPTIKIHQQILFEKVYYESLEEIIPIHPAMPKAGRKPYVNLLIPSLQKSSFFGGTATALIVAAKIAHTSHLNLRIVETLRHGKANIDELVIFLNKAGISIDAEQIEMVNISGRRYNHYGYLDIHPEDVFIVSAWWDAYLVDRLPLLKPYIYLIQDYEPIFYNNSDKYVLAESTYHSSKYVPVLNTELMYNFMVSEGYTHIQKNGLWFEPAINMGSEYGYIALGEKPLKRLFFYGRESVSRNLFFSGLNAINHVFATQQLLPENWEVFMAGQDGMSNIVLESGAIIKNLGKMPLEDYHHFIKTVDVAVSLMMAPHPNYPTLEFASCGAAVVTTSYKTKKDLNRYSKNIIVTGTDETSLAEAIVKASIMDTSQRLQNAKKSNIATSWNTSLDPIINEVLKKIY